MVAEPERYRWSSAAAHCRDQADAWLEMQWWRAVWTPATWRAYLTAAGAEADAEAIRRNTHTGRPLGGEDFVTDLERALRRRLAPGKGGRPPKTEVDARQQSADNVPSVTGLVVTGLVWFPLASYVNPRR